MTQYPRDDIWLTDGYGDFVRHYLRAMASVPKLAPDGQNHLLRTSSVIRSISYGQREIRYVKFDAASEEIFKLGAGKPVRVEGASMEWDPDSRVLRLHSRERSVTVSLAP
jgi:hypothetical protein